MSCPNGYVLDPRTGLCVAPCQTGYTYYAGDCIQNCPGNTRLNDQKECVRPVFSRASFVNESQNQNTTLVLGGSIQEDGAISYGSFATTDIQFSQPVTANGPVTALVKTASKGSSATFLVFEDQRALDADLSGQYPVPVETLQMTGTQFSTVKASLSNASGKVNFADVQRAAFVPTLGSSLTISDSVPNIMDYTKPGNNPTATLAYDIATNANEEVLYFTGGRPSFTNLGTTNVVGTTNSGSVRTDAKYQSLVSPFSLVYDVRSRNGYTGLIAAGIDNPTANVRYTSAGSNYNLSIPWNVSNVFRYDSPVGNDLEEIEDSTLYLFVRQTDDINATSFVGKMYEYRPLNVWNSASVATPVPTWTSGPLIPQDPKDVTISGTSYTSPTSIQIHDLLVDPNTPNVFFSATSAGTGGSCVLYPQATETIELIGPDAFGVSAAYHDAVTNFTAFATKATEDLNVDPGSVVALAVTFSTAALADIPDYTSSSNVNVALDLTAPRTRTSVEFWNGGDLPSPTAPNTWAPILVNVPVGATAARVTMWGAGGSGDATATGGAGGYTQSTINVTGIPQIQVIVGSAGNQLYGISTTFAGGDGGVSTSSNVGQGGGRTAIQIAGQLDEDILTAGGGGGARGSGSGGPGGGLSAGTYAAGLPGTNSSGNTDSNCGGGGSANGLNKGGTSNLTGGQGQLFEGGNGNSTGGGFAGGGSGYYGGGAASGADAGAGGGSSYAYASATATTFSVGNGYVPPNTGTNLYPQFRPGYGQHDSSSPTEGFALIEFLFATSSPTPSAPNQRKLYVSKTSTWYTNNLSDAGFWDSNFFEATYDIGSVSNPAGTFPGPVTNVCLSSSGSNIVVASMQTAAQQWNPSVAYNLGDIVRFENIEYQSVASANLNQQPDESTDWVQVAASTRLIFTLAGNSTFFTFAPNFTDCLTSEGASISTASVNSIATFPGQSRPTFVLLGEGYQILQYVDKGNYFDVYNGTIGPQRLPSSQLEFLGAGYESSQNAMVLAARPTSMNVSFVTGSQYAPSFCGEDVPNPLVLGFDGQPAPFSKKIRFANNGSVTVSCGGPFLQPQSSPAAGYPFTGWNIAYPPAPLGSEQNTTPVAYLSFCTTPNPPTDIRYQNGAYAVPLSTIPSTSPPVSFMSPANILMSTDNGASYSLVFDDTARSKITNYMLTYFNSWAPVNGYSITTSGNVNTAEFTDVVWLPDEDDPSTGYFLAAGKYIWDVNSLLSDVYGNPYLTNVIWCSRKLQSLDDAESASYWKPLTVQLDSATTDPFQVVSLEERYVVTERGAYTIDSIDYAEQSITLVPTANAGTYPAICTVPVGTGCDACGAGSFLHAINVYTEPSVPQSTVNVCIEAANAAAAVAAADALNGTTNPVPYTDYTTFIPTTDKILVELWGAGGQNTGPFFSGGGGGYIKATISNIPANTTMLLVVGKVGGNSFNTGFGGMSNAGKGGGFSGLFLTGNQPLAVAPGGGGGGSTSGTLGFAPLATGGGGGLPSNPSFDPVSPGTSGDSPVALVNNNTFGGGAGGGYGLGNPGQPYLGAFTGGSGGAFFPTGLQYTLPNGIVVKIEELSPGQTLGNMQTSATQAAVPGGTDSPNYVLPVGRGNQNGYAVVTPYTGVGSYYEVTIDGMDIGLSGWKNTLINNFPVANDQHFACPIDPGFQSTTSLTVTGTKYSTELQAFMPTGIPVSVKNVLTNGMPSIYGTPVTASNQNLVWTGNANQTFDDLFQVPVFNNTRDGTYGQIIADAQPQTPSDTNTISVLEPTLQKTFTLTTFGWAKTISGNNDMVTFSNYQVSGTQPEPSGFSVETITSLWPDFGCLYKTGSTVQCTSGPGTTTVSQVLTDYASKAVPGSYTDSVNAFAGLLPTPYQKDLLQIASGTWFTNWNNGTLPVTNPDPALVLHMNTSASTPNSIQSSFALQATLSFFRPRNWYFCDDFSVSGGYQNGQTSQLSLVSQQPGTTSTSSKTAEFVYDYEAAGNTDVFANTIVGSGRYTMYTYNNGVASSAWPAWTVNGSSVWGSSTPPSDVLYAMAPASVGIPAQELIVYWQRNPTVPSGQPSVSFMVHFFVKATSSAFTWTTGSTSAALDTPTRTALIGGPSDGILDGEVYQTIDGTDYVFDPYNHVYFCDPYQGGTLATGLDDRALTYSTQKSSLSWSLANLNAAFETSNGSIVAMPKKAYFGTNDGTNSISPANRLLYARKILVGVSESPTIDSAVGVPAPVAQGVTTFAGYVWYQYVVVLPSTQSPTLSVGSLALSTSLWNVNANIVNVNNLAINVEPVNGQPQLQSISPNGTANTLIADVSDYQNQLTKTFTRYMKDYRELWKLYGSFFPQAVQFKNPFFTPLYTTANNVSGVVLAPLYPAPNLPDPEFCIVSENASQIWNPNYVPGDSTTESQNGGNPTSIDGDLTSAQYDSTTGVDLLLTYSAAQLTTTNQAGVTGVSSLGYMYFTSTSNVVYTVPFRGQVSSFGSSTVYALCGQSYKDLTTPTSFSPNVCRDPALQNSAYPTSTPLNTPVSTTFTYTSDSSLNSNAAFMLHVDNPSAKTMYVVLDNPNPSVSWNVTVRGVCDISMAQYYKDLVDALPHNSYGLRQFTNILLPTFLGLYIPVGDTIAGNARPTLASLPSSSKSYLLSSINNANKYYPKIVVEVPVPAQQTFNWYYNSVNIVWTYYRPPLKPDSYPFREIAPRRQSAWITNGFTTAGSTNDFLAIDPIADPMTNANAVVGILNQLAFVLNNTQYNLSGALKADADFLIVENIATIPGSNLYAAINFSAVRVGGATGPIYLQVTLQQGGGDGVPTVTGETFYPQMCIDFRFLDPMTRKILGLRRATKIYLRPTLFYDTTGGGETVSTTVNALFPDPMDFSSSTQSVVFTSGSNGAIASINIPAINVSVYDNISNIPPDAINASLTLTGGGPVNVDPVYQWNVVNTYYSSLQNSAIQAYMGGLANASDYLSADATSTLPLYNFNGFNSPTLGTFLGFTWNYWPWSCKYLMTLEEGKTTYQHIADSGANVPECCAPATRQYNVVNPSDDSVVPTDMTSVPNSDFALLTTNFQDVRLCNVPTGDVVAISPTNCFQRMGIGYNVLGLHAIRWLPATQGQWFLWTGRGPYTTLWHTNSEEDIVTGNVRALTYVPVFDTGGQCAIQVLAGPLARLNSTALVTSMDTARVSVGASKKTVLVITFNDVGFDPLGYTVILWFNETNRLVYSLLSSTNGILGAGFSLNNLLAGSTNPYGLQYVFESQSVWTNPTTISVTYADSNVFTSDASVELPAYDPGLPNDVVFLFSELEQQLMTGIDNFPKLLPSNNAQDSQIPLYNGNWQTSVAITALANFASSAPVLNPEGVSFSVLFTDPNLFVQNPFGTFPLCGLTFDEYTRALLNFSSPTYNGTNIFLEGNVANQSTLTSIEYFSDSWPNFFRNVFVRVLPPLAKKETPGTLQRYRSTLRKATTLFSDFITANVTEIDAGLHIADVAYSPERNYAVWIPNGSYGSAPVQIADVTGIPLVPVALSAPVFTNSGKASWNPYLSCFLVAGYTNEVDVYRLTIGSTLGAWTQVTSGNEPLKDKLENMSVTALGSCPTCEVIAGDVNGITSIWFRNYAETSWNKVVFEQPGFITALAFVGFGWYIATWDPTVQTPVGFGLSSLWFAPANFAVVVYVDEWEAANRVMKITSINFYSSQTTGTCPSGFEPAVDDPNVCYKTCPTGFQAYGSMCAGICPTGFGTSENAFTCIPNRYTPARTNPIVRSGRALVPPAPTTTFDSLQGTQVDNTGALGISIGVGAAIFLGASMLL
jgi:hypothetical protein